MKAYKSLSVLIILLITLSCFSIASSSFQETNNIYHYGPIYSINVLDYDGDLSKEIALGCERGIDIIEYDKSGIASCPCDIVTGSKKGSANTIANSIFIGDLADDGIDDIIFGAFDKYIYFYPDSDLEAGPSKVYVWGEVLSSALADYDGDGTIEFIIGTTEGKIAAYSWSSGTMALEAEKDLSIGVDNYIFDIIVEDVTGDPTPELIAGAGYEDIGDNHFGKTYLLDGGLNVLWGEDYGEYVFDVETFDGKVLSASDEVSMVDPGTGTELWDYTIGDYTFLYVDDKIYAGSQNDHLYSFGANGDAAWGPVDVGSEVNSLYVKDGIVSVASDCLSLYDSSNGGFLSSVVTPAKVNQVVMVGSEIIAGTNDGTLLRYDQSLNPLWATPYQTRDKVLGLDVSGDLVATGGKDKFLRVYDLESNLLWEKGFDGKASAVAASGEYVCCGDYTGRLTCYQNGIEIWNKDYGCQIRDIDTYDMFYDGTPDVVIGLGRTGDDNVICLDMANGNVLFSAELPGWAYSVGCGDIDNDTFGEVVAGSMDLHLIDRFGNVIWGVDLGTYTNDAIIYEGEDNSRAYAVSVGGSSTLTALNCNGDALWEFTEDDEDLLSVCAGDIDGDGGHEVIAGGDNNVFILDQCGNLLQKDYQFRDVPSMESLEMGESAIAAFMGAYGVDNYHGAPVFDAELMVSFDLGNMKLYVESGQYLSSAPSFSFEGAQLGAIVHGDGWISGSVPIASGTFSANGANILKDPFSVSMDVSKDTMDWNDLAFSVDEWDCAIYTATPTSGELVYGTSENDPRMDGNDAVGSVLTLSLDADIEGSLDHMTLTNTYDEGDIPEGLPETLLGLYHWSEADGVFVECADYDIDTVNNEISGTLASNGSYAIMPKLNEMILQNGWNLISWNYAPDDSSIASLFSGYTDNIDYLYLWDPGTGLYEYCHYIAGYGWAGNFASIDNEHGYWVHLTGSPETYGIMGDNTIVSDMQIKSGWNLVCWPREHAASLSDALSSVNAHVDYVYRWDPVDKKYEYSHYINEELGWSGDFTELEPGYGYWFHSAQDCTWDIP